MADASDDEDVVVAVDEGGDEKGVADGVDGGYKDFGDGKRWWTVASTQLRLPVHPRKRRQIDGVVEDDADHWDLRIEIADETIEPAERRWRKVDGMIISLFSTSFV